MPKLNRVLETALYVADLDRAAAFYSDILGLPCIHEDHRMRAYDVGGNGVLLLFPEGGSLGPSRPLVDQSHLTTATAHARRLLDLRGRAGRVAAASD